MEDGSNNGAIQQSVDNAVEARVRRVMPSKVLPSDRLATEKQLAALRAFAAAYESSGKPVTNELAGSIIGMSKATVVVTNAFFSDMKLLLRQKEEQSFVPSQDTMAYYKAFEWDKFTAGEKLRPVFERAWFTEALAPRLKFRPYEEREALAVLAEASNAAKDYEMRLRVLLDMMVVAGVVIRDGNLLTSPGPRAVEPTALEIRQMEVAAAEQPNRTNIDEGHEQYTLVLDPRANRRVMVTAPHVVSRKELQRITKWLEFQLIVEDGEEEKPLF
jgi:hypothetical protein